MRNFKNVFHEVSRLKFVDNFQIYFDGYFTCSPLDLRTEDNIFPKSMRNIQKIKFLAKHSSYYPLFKKMKEFSANIKTYELEYHKIQFSNYY